MATRTSSQSGNWNDTSTWGGAAVPGDGDIAIITTSHTVTVTANATVGSNSSGIGHAITINGTSSSVYGKLVVNDGITLTLKGFDTGNNTLMRINQWGMFTPNPGAIISADIAGDFSSIIDNRGRVHAIGTISKPIIFTVPTTNYSWNTQINGEVSTSGTWRYNKNLNISTYRVTNSWISNAAGTGLGSYGNTSLSKTAGLAGAVITEVPTLDDVNAAGEYYVDYVLGIVFYYHTSVVSHSITLNYKYLTSAKGWGIKSIQNTTGHEALYNYCNFNFMGRNGTGDNHVVDFAFKQSTAVAADRLMYVKNCNFNYCWRAIGLKDITGTLADPILITGNTIDGAKGTTDDGIFSFFRASSSYIEIADNTLSAYDSVLGGQALYPTAVTLTGVNIRRNIIKAPKTGLAGFTGGYWSNCYVEDNTFYGYGGVNGSSRAITLMDGLNSANPIYIQDNTFFNAYRSIGYSSHNMIKRNVVFHSYHHGIQPNIVDYRKIENVKIHNNLTYGEVPASAGGYGYDASPSIETGYFDGQWIDDIEVLNNTTVGNPSGGFGFGNCQDTTLSSVHITRLVVANNLHYMNTGASAFAWKRTVDGANIVTKVHCLKWDNNLDYGPATRYGTGLTRQGTFSKSGSNYNTLTSPSRNITGVALFNPSASLSASSKTLDFTYTSATNQTLTFDGGTPKSIIFGNDTVNVATNNHNGLSTSFYNCTITVTGTPWFTVKNNATCPVGRWVKFTSGAANGDIFSVSINTSSRLTLAPTFAAGRVPVNGDTFVIIEGEVTLVDGSDSVQVGIYLPELPISTQSDSGITFADHSVTGSNPSLTAPTTQVKIPLPTDSFKYSDESPAQNTGTNEYYATDDYFGNTRPSNPSIGFFELIEEIDTLDHGLFDEKKISLTKLIWPDWERRKKSFTELFR